MAKTLFVNNFLVSEPHAHSRAAYLMLVEEYKALCPPPWKIWLEFRDRWLSDILAKEGSLTCEYCGKTNLDKDTKRLSILATVDHVIPTSKGGKKYDTSNMKVSCYKCNIKKGDQIYEMP